MHLWVKEANCGSGDVEHIGAGDLDGLSSQLGRPASDGLAWQWSVHRDDPC